MGSSKKAVKNEKFNLEKGRYETFTMSNDWLELLYKTDDVKGMSNSEIAKKAFEDILSGRVTQEDIDKAKKEKEKTVKPEEKEKEREKVKK